MSVPLVLEPRNQPGKRKYSKETTVKVIKINCLVNRCTSKYPLTRRDILHWQLSKLLNKPLYPQISIDIENKSVVLNTTVALTCILSSYMWILHVHWSLQFNKILSPVSIASLYIKRENYTKKGRETIMPIVTNNQYRSWLKIAVNMKLSYNASVLRNTYEGLTKFQSFM